MRKHKQIITQACRAQHDANVPTQHKKQHEHIEEIHLFSFTLTYIDQSKTKYKKVFFKFKSTKAQSFSSTPLTC